MTYCAAGFPVWVIIMSSTRTRSMAVSVALLIAWVFTRSGSMTPPASNMSTISPV